jgi:tetratricopeptide (TPR) repeat protein
VREGRANFPPAKPPIVRGDRPILERVASRHIADRTAVENAYLNGDEETRRSLLEAAIMNGDAAQVDLLRLAIFGLNVDLSRTARSALAQVKTPDAAELVNDALQVPLEPTERDALIGTLKRLGEASVRARWLAGVHQGLAGTSTVVNAEAWSGLATARRAPAPAFARGALPSHVEEQARAAYERPKDPAPRLEFAESNLALALAAPRVYATNPRIARLVSRHLFQDALRLAKEAEALGAKGWRLNPVLALALYYSGDRAEAYPRAEAAMKDIPPGDTSWASMAVVTIFAEARWKAIKVAVKEQNDWPTEWLSDVHSAYTVLMRHPLGTDGQVVWHYELLDWLGSRWRAMRVLYEGLERFPDSARIHEKFRERLLKYVGADGLEAAYDKLLDENGDPARLEPFAGLASIAAADIYRSKREYDKAQAAYSRAIAHYELAINADPGNREASDHAIALALAARARVAYQLGDDERALKEILASFARRPESAGSRDGPGITPGETAQMLLNRLRERKKDELAKELAAALAKIDPELLRPDIGLSGE